MTKKGLLLLVSVALMGAMAWRYHQPDGQSGLGQVVDVVGGHVADARIIAVVKGKYLLDKDVPFLAINVDCRDGEVGLRGSVPTREHSNRAVILARQTYGVRNVVSQLVVAD